MSKREEAGTREERLREALRENLKRRRAQARGRQQAQKDHDEKPPRPEADEHK